jgi:hypothetical protein
MNRLLLLTTLALSMACPDSKPAMITRAALNRTGGTTFEIVPTAEQFPYCLAYTVAQNGLTRQLTMSTKNTSFECPGGKPVAGHSFRVPMTDGPVKVIVLFTSQPVKAGSVSLQLLESANRQAINVMDLRLPGNASLEALEFTPEEDVAATVGQTLVHDSGADEADGGGSL